MIADQRGDTSPTVNSSVETVGMSPLVRPTATRMRPAAGVVSRLNMRVRFPVYQFNFYGKKQELIPAEGRTPVNHLIEHPNNG